MYGTIHMKGTVRNTATLSGCAIYEMTPCVRSEVGQPSQAGCLCKPIKLRPTPAWLQFPRPITKLPH
jgi:hypothetical protein